ncbi:MAG: DNA recombination protein RmuC [Actinobacteria bacterium]|nr:MAG: DNA recombination protein RmuC [Actinomycetota bacterium]
MDLPTWLVAVVLAAALGILVGAAIGMLALRRRDRRELAAAESSDMADLVAPLRQSLADLSAHLAAGEQRRTHDTAGITAELRNIARGQQDIARQTGELRAALRHPGVRGKWGEVQLTRIVEAAGLLPEVVHRPQTTLGSSRLRPDLVLDLGVGRQVVIDSKVPLDALLGGVSSDSDEDGEIAPAALQAHAAAVRDRVRELVGRQYTAQFERPPDFVLLFLPADPLLAAALAGDPAVVEQSYAKGVILATPATLLTLLRVIALAWREERAQDSAEELLRLAGLAVERVGTLAGHLQDLGTRIDGAVAAYNKVAGSWQVRVRPVARRIAEHTGDTSAVGELGKLDRPARTIDPLLVADAESLPGPAEPVA